MMYKVTDEILDKLKGAKKIGFILQHVADAFIFVGYDQFSFENGASKIPGLLSLFRRHTKSNGEGAAAS
jgi:hypothetical protein